VNSNTRTGRGAAAAPRLARVARYGQRRQPLALTGHAGFCTQDGVACLTTAGAIDALIQWLSLEARIEASRPGPRAGLVTRKVRTLPKWIASTGSRLPDLQ